MKSFRKLSGECLSLIDSIAKKLILDTYLKFECMKIHILEPLDYIVDTSDPELSSIIQNALQTTNIKKYHHGAIQFYST